MEPPIIEPIEPFPAPFTFTYPIEPPLDPEGSYLTDMETQVGSEFQCTLRVYDETSNVVCQVALANTRAMRRLMEECTGMDDYAKSIVVGPQLTDKMWDMYISRAQDIFTGFAEDKIPGPSGVKGEYEDEAEEGECEAEEDMEEDMGYDDVPPPQKRARDASEESDDEIEERPAKRPRVRESYRLALEAMRSEIPAMPSKPDPNAPQVTQEKDDNEEQPQPSEGAQGEVIYGPEPQFFYVRPIVMKPRAPREEEEASAALPAAFAPELAVAGAPPARESTPVEVAVPAVADALPPTEFSPAEAPVPAPVATGDYVYALPPGDAAVLPASLFPPSPNRTFRTYDEAVAAGAISLARPEGHAPVNSASNSALHSPHARYPTRTNDGPPRYPVNIDVDAPMVDISSPAPLPLPEAESPDVQMEDAPGRSWRDDVVAYASAKAQQQSGMDEDIFGPILAPLPTSQRASAVGPIRSNLNRKQSWPPHEFDSSPTRGTFDGTPYAISSPIVSPSVYVRPGASRESVERKSSGSKTRGMLLAHGYPRPVDHPITDSEDEDAWLMPTAQPDPVVPAPMLVLRPGTSTPRPTQGPLPDDNWGLGKPGEVERILDSGNEKELAYLMETGIPRTYNGMMAMHIAPAGADVDFGLPPTPPKPEKKPEDWWKPSL